MLSLRPLLHKVIECHNKPIGDNSKPHCYMFSRKDGHLVAYVMKLNFSLFGRGEICQNLVK